MKLAGFKRDLVPHGVVEGRSPEGRPSSCQDFDCISKNNIPTHSARLCALVGSIAIFSLAAVAEVASSNSVHNSYFDASNSRLQNNGSSYSYTSSGTAMRFEVRPGDQPSFDSSSVERSEISSRKEIEFGKTYTLSYKFMVEPGIPLTSRWMLLGQVHHRNDRGERGGSPPFGVEVNGELIRVIARSSAEEIRAGNVSARTIWKADAPLERGRWYNMRFQFRFDPFGGGLVNMWIDGQQKLQYRGALGYNDKRGGYLKIGIYRAASKESVAVQYDGVEMTESLPTSTTNSERETGGVLGNHRTSLGSP